MVELRTLNGQHCWNPDIFVTGAGGKGVFKWELGDQLNVCPVGVVLLWSGLSGSWTAPQGL